MRVKILNPPSIDGVDGIRLDHFVVGREYDVGNSVGALLLAEGWAEPLPLDAPRPHVPFSENDPFDNSVLYPDEPPNLSRENWPPYLDRGLAADIKFRRRPRRR